GKKAGPGIVPGKPDESAVVQYVQGKFQPRMPKGAKPLEDSEIALIRSWIAQGAVDDSTAKLADAKTQATGVPAPPAPPTTQAVSADWDPQVQFNAAEAVAVRRF